MHDTTRHDNMGHDPFFSLTIQSSGQFTHAGDQVWSTQQKAAATKITMEAIFVVCPSDNIRKTAKENGKPLIHKFISS